MYNYTETSPFLWCSWHSAVPGRKLSFGQRQNLSRVFLWRSYRVPNVVEIASQRSTIDWTQPLVAVLFWYQPLAGLWLGMIIIGFTFSPIIVYVSVIIVSNIMLLYLILDQRYNDERSGVSIIGMIGYQRNNSSHGHGKSGGWCVASKFSSCEGDHFPHCGHHHHHQFIFGNIKQRIKQCTE